MSYDYTGRKEWEDEMRDATASAHGLLKTKRHARALGRDFKKRAAPCKACPHCYSIQANGTRICHECGYEFFEKVVKGPSPFKGKTNTGRPRNGDKRYK